VQVGESYGLKFPREFGLLLKQILYFVGENSQNRDFIGILAISSFKMIFSPQDRYVRLLAPELQVMTDKRIQMAREMPAGGPPPFAF